MLMGRLKMHPRKEIAAPVLEEKILQLYPSLATEIPTDDCNTPDKFLLNDKFCLINVAFSDELSDEALGSQKCATHAELDAGLVCSKSLIWVTVENRFNEGFPSDGPDGMTHLLICCISHTHCFTKMTPQWILLLW
jgi:hypothetical protein